jgi:hypothetical protein
MFFDEKTRWYTARNAAKNASLLIQLMQQFTKASTSFLYTRFRSKKQLTSKGYRI